jgi:hypothetical protein
MISCPRKGGGEAVGGRGGGSKAPFLWASRACAGTLFFPILEQEAPARIQERVCVYVYMCACVRCDL